MRIYYPRHARVCVQKQSDIWEHFRQKKIVFKSTMLQLMMMMVMMVMIIIIIIIVIIIYVQFVRRMPKTVH